MVILSGTLESAALQRRRPRRDELTLETTCLLLLPKAKRKAATRVTVGEHTLLSLLRKLP